MERKANTMDTDCERDTDIFNGLEMSVSQGTASRKRALSLSVSPCALSLDEASDRELRACLEENAFQALAQKSVIKKPRVELVGDRDAPFELNFAALSFPRKLWHIVENETYKSIGWDPRGIYVVIDDELFVTEILSKEGDSKIFVTTNIKNFVRQLNLYGFKKVRLSEYRSLPTTSRDARESASKKQVFQNSSFCRGHPELLNCMKRRVRVRSKQASGSGKSPSACASRSLLPQRDSNESSLDTSDATVDYSFRNNLSQNTTTTSTSTEASLNSTLLRVLSLLTEITSLAQGSTAESLITGRLQAIRAALSTPGLLASGLAPTSPLVASAPTQSCPNCGHNLLPSESSNKDNM